ncbi:MAG: FtsX-like permease family protein, partial [Acidobacteria bacterium]|nr:FtsX-like permease family protein [Acidobacteriota bacterium]
ARAADRRREIAIRLALGAGRGRLIRQLLTESLLIAIGAGTVGFLMSVWVMRLGSQLTLPYPMPLNFDLQPDGRVLLFTLALTAFTGVALGLVPALQATRADLTPALKEGGNVPLSRYRRLSLRNALVLSQVAGSLALLLINGFVVIGHQKMAGIEVGFDPNNLYLVSLDPVRDGYSGAQSAAFFEKLLDRVKASPAVAAASLADSVPMGMIGKPPVTFSVTGPDGAGSREIHSARKYVVGKDFFATIGIPILLGRGFRKEDEANGAMAVIVSERLVRDCWKGQDPLGRPIEIGNEEVPQFRLAGAPQARRFGASGSLEKYQVVGVAKDVRDGLVMVAADAPPLIYVPLHTADYARPPLQGVTLMVRSAPGADALGAVWREVSAMDANIAPFDSRSMPEQIERLVFPVRAALWTYACVGLFGLILSAVGLAGVTAYSVTRRRREIGIRVALGAQRTGVLRLVMTEGLVLVTAGTVIGFAIAWAGMRVLSAFMSMVARTAGTSYSDPVLLLGAPLLLAVLALLACYVPARKSLRIDPAVALRQE